MEDHVPLACAEREFPRPQTSVLDAFVDIFANSHGLGARSNGRKASSDSSCSD